MFYENEQDEEYWMSLAEEKGEELGVDTREGSVYMDMQAGHCIRTAKLYNDLASVRTEIMPDTAQGDYLSAYAKMDDIVRKAATPACWSAVFEGTVPDEESEFMCGESYLTWREVGGTMCLVANDPGEEMNMLASGSELVPVDNIDDLESAALGELIVPGRAGEKDESLRLRWQESKVKPKANSNLSQIKSLCEEIEGVGRVRLLPLWGGPNTVKAVFCSSLGQGMSDESISEIQQYMDPIEEGYVVEVTGEEYVFGDGLGEGAVNIGLHFLAVSAIELFLKISADIELKEGYTLQQVLDTAKGRIHSYLSKIALETPDRTEAIVRISAIGSIIAEVEGILDYDYDSLRINGMAENIVVNIESVAVLSEVVLNVSR